MNGSLIMDILQKMQMKLLRKGVNEEYLKKLMEPTDFLYNIRMLTYESAVAAGLLKYPMLLVDELSFQRKTTSIFIIHSDYIKVKKFCLNDDIYRKRILSVALYSGFLCALKWLDKSGDSEEISCLDCIVSGCNENKAESMLCKKYGEDTFTKFLNDLLDLVVCKINSYQSKDIERNTIHSLSALFQLGATLAVYET